MTIGWDIEKLRSNYLFETRRSMVWHRVAARLYMELHPETDFEDIIFKLDPLFSKMNDDEMWQIVEVDR